MENIKCILYDDITMIVQKLCGNCVTMSTRDC